MEPISSEGEDYMEDTIVKEIEPPTKSFLVEDEEDLEADDNKVRAEDEIMSSTSSVIQKSRSPEDLAEIAFRGAFKEICGELGEPYLERAIRALKITDNFTNLNMTLFAKAALYSIKFKYIKKNATNDDLSNFIKSYVQDLPMEMVYRAASDLSRYIILYLQSDAKK